MEKSFNKHNQVKVRIILGFFFNDLVKIQEPQTVLKMNSEGNKRIASFFFFFFFDHKGNFSTPACTVLFQSIY